MCIGFQWVLVFAGFPAQSTIPALIRTVSRSRAMISPIESLDRRASILAACSPPGAGHVYTKLRLTPHRTVTLDGQRFDPDNPEARLYAIREAGPGRGQKKIVSGFQSFLAKIGMTSPTATVAQRIGALPAKELESALAESRQRALSHLPQEVGQLREIASNLARLIARESRYRRLPVEMDVPEWLACVVMHVVAHAGRDLVVRLSARPRGC
jgi:hypothetical protein